MVEQLTNTHSNYQDSWRDLRAIRNDRQKNFINSLDFKSFLWEDKSEEFLNNFTEWVKGSKLNDFSKLDSYPMRLRNMLNYEDLYRAYNKPLKKYYGDFQPIGNILIKEQKKN